MLLSYLNLLATAPNGVAKLRELILTLAVQGKLVPQDPSDEPASELLKKIRAEKDRLMAEGKIKRDKPLAEIAEEEKPFELPVGWEWVRLAAVAFPQAGFAFKSSGFNEAAQGLPLIRIRDVGDSDPRTFFSGDYREEFVVESGDWLISMDGEFRVREWLGPNALLNQRVTRLMFYGEDVFQPFVAASLQFKLSELQGTKAYTTVDHLSGGQIAACVIALPPLAEQSRIVTRVEELMRLCDALEAKARLEATQHEQLVRTLLSTLTNSTTPEELTENWHRVATHFDLLLDRPEAVDALEQTILQLAVRGLLVPQDPQDEPASTLLQKIRAEKDRLIAEGKIKRDKPLPPIAEEEKPFELPSGWEWTRMQTAFDVRDGTHDTPKYVERDGVPLITSKNFEDGKINFHSAKLISTSDHESIMKRSRVERNDILYSMIGGNIGNQVIVDTDREFSIKNVALFKCVSVALTQPLFLHLFLETATLTMQQRAVGGAQPFVSLSLLRNIPFPLPPTAEQSRIVARVASLRALCADLRQRLTNARAQQALLAQVLVQGQ